MAYSTRCTCNEMQLAHVGCDCNMDGPFRVVLSYDEQVAADEARADALDAADRAAEMAYWEKLQADELAAEAALFGPDPREDFAEYMLEAARHQ